MTTNTALYVALLAVAALAALFLAAWVWTQKRRATPGVGYFSLLMVSVALWSLTGAWEAAVGDVALKILATKIQYIAVVAVAPLWFFTALVYGRIQGGVKHRLLPLLWIVPVVMTGFVWTNEAHGLVWPSITPVPGSRDLLLAYAHGPAALASAAYSYLLVFAGTLIILRTAFRTQRIFRLQAAALIFGAFFPLAASVVYLFQLTPSAVDWTPVAFALSGVAIAWGLFRYGLMSVLPVAQGVLMAGMKDGVVILDDLGRVIGLNPAAVELTGWTGDAIGRRPADLRPEGSGCAHLEAAIAEGPGEQSLYCPDCDRFIEVRVSELADRRRRPIGRLLVLRDITAKKRVEAENSRSLARARIQQQAVVKLAVSPAILQGDFDAAAAEITETAARAMGVERTSVWLAFGPERSIRTADLFEMSTGAHSRGDVLRADRYPGYFEAISGDRVVDAADALTDPRTREFAAEYLGPLGISSLLDAPIRVGGRLAGVVCFEHVGPARNWLPDEVRFAGEIADQAAQALLSRDRTAAEAALRASLSEKEVLLKEVHHRVKNNMQIVSSLLNHQARLVRDPQVLGIFKESQNRIRSIALVHEKLYRSADFSRIDFAGYILALVPHLVQTASPEREQVRFVPALEPTEVTITTAVPLGLIVNELVMNALQHAFPDGRRGEVRVEIGRAADGRTRLVVADDGVGLPAGFDIRSAESLGLQIISMLVGQINGEISFGAGPGARFEILFS